MVKPEKKIKSSAVASTSDTSSKYKGVRLRKWGKYVSEIRLPNCRERIWLGSYDSAEKAARAFDAALFCLRGPSAKFNFPDCPPDIPGGRSMTPQEIQTVSAQYACSVVHGNDTYRSVSESSSSSSSDLHVDSPSLSVSDGQAQTGNETVVDGSFLDFFSSMGTDYNVTESYMYPGFDDFTNEFYVPPPIVDDYPEEQYHYNGYSHDSLWNFN